MPQIKALTDLRKEHGMTQEAQAAYLGIARSTLAQYETGFKQIPADILRRLSTLYRLPMDTLYALSRQETPHPHGRPPEPAPTTEWSITADSFEELMAVIAPTIQINATLEQFFADYPHHRPTSPHRTLSLDAIKDWVAWSRIHIETRQAAIATKRQALALATHGGDDAA